MRLHFIAEMVYCPTPTDHDTAGFSQLFNTIQYNTSTINLYCARWSVVKSNMRRELQFNMLTAPLYFCSCLSTHYLI